MKLFVAHPNRVRRLARRSRGMTVLEAVLSTFLWTTVVGGGLFAVHLMGLREEQLLESKAGASDSARRNIGQLRTDIYAAKGWSIGTWNGTNFTGTTNDQAQQGNALIIYPLIITSNQIVDTSKYILYYFDTSQVTNFNGRLWYLNSTNGVNYILVSNLIVPLKFPGLYFIGEDYAGVTKSNLTYKSVIHTTFQFSQFQFPLTKVGSNGLFNSYRIDVRATPHLPDGP